MKKQLPGWAVLLIITLVAGLALGGTNALTKDPIAQQARIKAENARKAALPDAESFEELALNEGAAVDWVYAGLKGGSPVGYVAQKTVNGFGGKVEVIAGVDTVNAPDTFKIGGITVGGSDFSETAGLGARAKEPAFTNQFPGKIYPISYIKAGGEATESTVDALTSATITTTAVVNGVNDIVKYVKADVMGIAGVEMPAKPADGVFSSSEKGFRGPVYVEAAFDGAGKVTYMKVGDESFAEDIGVGVIEPDFMIQFIGKQMPLEVSDIDVIAGATISSTAVVKALNNAYAIAGGAEIVVPETPTMPEKPAEGVYSASADGFRGPVYVEAAFDAENKITYISVGDDSFAEDVGMGVKEPEFMAQFIGKTAPMEVSDIDVITGATISSTAVVNGLNKAYNASQGIVEEVVEIVMPEKPAEGVFSASEKGFAGPVYTEAAFDADGKITYISVGDDQFAETEGFGARALVAENLYPFIGAQMPLNVEDVDALTGATFTKTAIVNSLNKAYKASKGEVEEEPVKQEAPAAEPAGETFGADADGFQSTVHVEAAFDGDKITALTIGDKRFDETPGFGARALEPETAEAFIGKTMPLAVEDVDTLTGATFTKTAVVEALNKAYTKYQTAQEAPAEEPAASGSAVSATVQGFGGPVYVEAEFDGNTIASIKIGDDQFAETPGLGARALEEDFQKQFIGKQMPISLSDIDALSGATITSTAVVDALNAAYATVAGSEETAAPEQSAVEAKTYTAEITSGDKVLKLEATVESGTITALKVSPSAREAALQEKFVGAALPLSVQETDADFFSVAVALNKAAGAEAVPATEDDLAEAAEPTVAEKLLAKNFNATGEATIGSKDVQVIVTCVNNNIAGLVVLDKDAGSEASYAVSERDGEMKDLFLAKSLPLDPDAQDSAYAAAIASLINKASGVEGASKEENAFAKAEKVLEKKFGVTAETAVSGKDLQIRVTNVNNVIAGLVVLEKAEDYKVSALDAEMKDLFLAKSLPLDVNGQRTVAAATVANAINVACGFDAQEITVVETKPTAAKPVDAQPQEPEKAQPADFVEESISGNSALKITAGFEDGKLTSLSMEPQEVQAAMQEKFLGAQMPVSIDQEDITALTVAVAINKAYSQYLAEQPETPAAEPKEEAAEEAGASSVVLRVTAEFENETLSGLSVLEQAADGDEFLPSAQEEALKEKFIGQPLPLDTNQASALEATAAIAINKAYYDAAHEAEPQQSEDTGIIGGADEPTAIVIESGDDEPVYLGEAISFFTAIRATIKVSPTGAVKIAQFEEKPVGAEEYASSPRDEELQALFVGEPLPLDVNAYDDAFEAAAAVAVNAAYQQFPGTQDEDSVTSDAFGFGESISFFTQYRVAATFENGRLVTFGAYKALLNSDKVAPIDCIQLNELLDGQEMPLPTDCWTVSSLPEYEMTAIVIALNQAYVNSLAGLQ